MEHDEADEPEDNECPHCWGTGEGQYDGSSCGSCRGKGYIQLRYEEEP